MAVAPHPYPPRDQKPQTLENGYVDRRLENVNDDGSGESEDDSDLSEIDEQPYSEDACVAVACDDGCVRLYMVSDLDDFIYHRSLPRVSGETFRPLGLLYEVVSTSCEPLELSLTILFSQAGF